jgi:hypothetical protein
MLSNKYIALSSTPLGAAGVFTQSTQIIQTDGGIQTQAAGGQTSFAAQVASTTGQGMGKTINVMCLTDQASAANGLQLQISVDGGTTWRMVAQTSVVANTAATLSFVMTYAGAQYRVVLTNGATLQTFLILGASLTEI